VCRNPGRSNPESNPGKTCHSNVIRCHDRLVMPRQISDHSKLLVKLNDVFMVVWTISIVLLRLTG